jgi:putative ABC transport system permease protein
MFTNYLKIALRSLWKNKAFAAINIIGLSIGLASFVLITLYVVDELGFDRYHAKANRIYRINSDIKFGGSELKLAVTSDPMGAALKKDYPQVEEYTRVYYDGPQLVKKGTQFLDETGVGYVDSTFFNVFSFPSIYGDTRNALKEPNTAVVTEATAKKYFGTTDAIGKQLELSNHRLVKVNAVIKDMPANSHFRFDFLLSMKDVQYQFGNFLSHNFQTYLVLRQGTDYKAFEKNFDQFIDKYIMPQAKQFMQISSMAEFRKSGNYLLYSLMPLTDIHLKSDRTAELGVNSNIQYVYVFSVVALFVLLLACINFMNLSTARSANRAKEVGIRKVLGSDKRSLISQFLVESTLMAFCSLVIALLIVWQVMPLFNDLSGKTLAPAVLFAPAPAVFLLLLPLVIGLLAGSYPAFFLSAFKPVAVLKGKINAGFKRSRLRNALVVFQFATSIILIVGTVVVYNQLNYIRTTRIGFQKDQVLNIFNTRSLGNNLQAFKNDVLKMPGIKTGTVSGFLPVPSSRNDNTFSKEAVIDSKSGLNMQVWAVDEEYLNTMGMEMARGRFFSKNFGTDSTAIVINESAAQLLGYADPIGKKIYGNSQGAPGAPLFTYTVIGVVKNFHYESMHQHIGPLSMLLISHPGITSFKVSAGNLQPLLKQVEAKWKALNPAVPFNYQFMDDAFNNMYRAEQRVGKVAVAFALLAIIIACLGLFGLVTYAAEQRTREVGIRKVLGASVSSIVTLLSKDLLVLVLIAALFAFPIAWYAMHTWLQDFAYRIQLSWWVFAMAGFAALLIAFLTVCFQAIKAAVANPVKSLRTE